MQNEIKQSETQKRYETWDEVPINTLVTDCEGDLWFKLEHEEALLVNTRSACLGSHIHIYAPFTFFEGTVILGND